MIVVDVVASLLTLLAASAAVLTRQLVSAVVLVGVATLVAAYFFLRLGAPDVAMTEAAIGAGLSTFLFLVAVRRTEEREEERR